MRFIWSVCLFGSMLRRVLARERMRSFEEEGEGSGKHDGMRPNDEDLHPAVRPRAAVLAGAVRIHAEKSLVVAQQVGTGDERSDEDQNEDGVNEIKGVGV
jgi:hypothetical protein